MAAIPSDAESDEPPVDEFADHRALNRELRIFDTDPLAGAGLPLWSPPAR